MAGPRLPLRRVLAWLFLAFHLSAVFARSVNLVERAVLGGACNATINCTVSHSSCVFGQCTCDTGYSQSGASCVVPCSPSAGSVELGGCCTATTQCKTPTAGVVECNQNKCNCYHNLVACGTACILPAIAIGSLAVGQCCFSDAQCMGTGVSCIGTPGSCTCKPGYTASGTTCTPTPTSACGSPAPSPLSVAPNGCCDTSSQCKDSNSQCTSNKCACNAGYQVSGTMCVLSGPTTVCGTAPAANSVALGNCCDTTSQCMATYSVCTLNKCACPANYPQSGSVCSLPPTGPCGVSPAANSVALGSCCETASQCQTTNTICTSNKCACAGGYHQSGATCLQDNSVPFGGACSSSTDCAGTNVACTSGVCSCASGYTAASGSCLAGNLAHGATCAQPAQCSGALTCVSGVCDCGSGYVWGGSGTSCYPTRAIAPDGACLVSDQCQGNLQCLSGKCACAQTGMVLSGNTCLAGGLTAGGACTVTEQCVGSLNCISGQCGCTSGYTISGTTCNPITGLAHGSTCTESSQCALGLTCSGTCICATQMIWSGSACLTVGLVAGGNCSVKAQCSGNLSCISGSCSCASGFYLCGSSNSECCQNVVSTAPIDTPTVTTRGESSTSNLSQGTIIGIAIGGAAVVFVVAAVLGVFLLRRRTRHGKAFARDADLNVPPLLASTSSNLSSVGSPASGSLAGSWRAPKNIPALPSSPTSSDGRSSTEHSGSLMNEERRPPPSRQYQPHWFFLRMNGPGVPVTEASIPFQGQPIIALANHIPRSDDEIELASGEFVDLRTVYKDGWGIGTNIDRGTFGAFPLDCLRLDDFMPSPTSASTSNLGRIESRTIGVTSEIYSKRSSMQGSSASQQMHSGRTSLTQLDTVNVMQGSGGRRSLGME